MSWQRVVIGWDGTEEAGRALERVAAAAPAAEVILATVSDPDLAWMRHQRLAQPSEILAEGARAAHRLGLAVTPRALSGDTAEQLALLATEAGADAIVVGVHHHGVMLRMFGGVGVDLALRAPCDVVIAT